MKIVIAGASGFVGSHLIQALGKGHELVGLSRGPRTSNNGVRWVQCDLFSLLDLEKNLVGADVAVYLVHSMLPSARLTQGSFRDFDMILADNFARACKINGVKRIVYLSGIIPPDAILSEHLQSRLEVENILKGSGIPTSCLRAGLIIGPGGASFEMMYRLVRRLPFMVCPYWTSTLSFPVSVWDVAEILKNRIEALRLDQNECLDLCGADPLSYEEMMLRLSRFLGRRHLFIPIPYVSPKLSKLWVRLITGAPRDLVYPLVDSLKTHMIPLQPRPKELSFIQPMSFEDALKKTFLESQSNSSPNAFRFTGAQSGKSYVRSVQRVTTLFRSDARHVAISYFAWLGSLFPMVLTVERPQPFKVVTLRIFGFPVLVLELAEGRSSPDRQLFYIIGGILVGKSNRARIEFRSIYQGLYKIIAIHDFRPRLPWFVYKYFQAFLHLWVMRAFGKFLIRSKA